MIREDLNKSIQNSVDRLLRLAKMSCRNTISGNIFYIVSDFNEYKGENGTEQRRLRNRINNSKELLDLDAAVEILKKDYHDLYDINLYVFRSFKRETIIEIQFYRKSNFDADYFALIKDHPPMFHSKISIPVYALEGGKFDVNWQSGGGWHHVWKSFLFKTFMYRRKAKGKKLEGN
ncbi:hypothetical protein [Chryseobacterium arthrosphaerae]|uniref:hypothetical protein n=1 Tax=Chryseobacterium arthrosphaerae TaxID=651561 RepID=UPI001F4B203C|nr:hypothetical protein [Chryseobacterium arthrosphaerae]